MYRRYERNWTRRLELGWVDPLSQVRGRLVSTLLARYVPVPGPVLDAGSGSRNYTKKFVGLGCEVTALDWNEKALSVLANRCPAAKVLRTDLNEPLPLRAESFSAVWFSSVLEHMEEPRCALEEAARVLRPGGVLIAVTRAHTFIKNFCIVLFRFNAHFNPYGPQLRFFTRRLLAEGLSRVGVESVEWRTLGRHWPVSHSLLVVARKPVR